MTITNRSGIAELRRIRRRLNAAAILLACLGGAGNAAAQAAATPTPAPTRLEALGQRIFNDRNLSQPAGTACVSCHTANTGFANNNGSRIGVALGSLPTSLGMRNAMANGYSAFVPTFSFRNANGRIDAVGGHFWDGRADTLALQALGPFLNAAEMNNPSAAAVVSKVAASNYADLMRAEFGATIFSTPDLAFQKLGVAIAAFESTAALQPFTSKYDLFIKGQATLTAAEARGMQAFRDPNRGNCASCHTMNPNSADPRNSLFTDFSFHALGIPRNTQIPANANPAFFDLGLCGPVRTRPALTANVPANVTIEQFCGAFRMVSLRNVGLRQNFMHNGFFNDLRAVVTFYATRNSNPERFYGPAAVPNDLPNAYLGNIVNDRVPFNRPRTAPPALTGAEVGDIVAFLRTLSDGFVAGAAVPVTAAPPTPPAPPARPPAPPPVARNPF